MTYTTKHTTLGVLFSRCLKTSKGASDNTPVVQGRVAAKCELNLVTTVECSKNSSSSSTNGRVARDIVGVAWRGTKQRCPGRVRNITTAGEPNIGALNSRHRTPRSVEELGLPGGDGGVGKGIVELGVKLGRLDDLGRERILDD